MADANLDYFFLGNGEIVKNKLEGQDKVYSVADLERNSATAGDIKGHSNAQDSGYQLALFYSEMA
jgi:hypothetical protein